MKHLEGFDMKKTKFNEEQLKLYREYLLDAERSKLTIEKYIRDVRAFFNYIHGGELDRGAVLAYKQHLIEKYKPSSVNSMLAALNGFLTFSGRAELKVKPLKIQRKLFIEPEKELAQEEYVRLLETARDGSNERLYLLMQTICATGIRVSELKFITVETVRAGRGEISSKGKRRTVFIIPKLKRVLTDYIERNGIQAGSIFVTRHGTPLSRNRIWADMKSLCENANVSPLKVFPHNLRHLFARLFYSIEKDLGRLADILGHSNINTTRIYTMESGLEHEKIMARLALVYQ